jgi:hypothetical protein
MMLLLALVAVWALDEPRQADREVAASLTLSGVRDTPLRNSHGLSWLLSGYASGFGKRVIGSCGGGHSDPACTTPAHAWPTGECSRSGARRRRKRPEPCATDPPATVSYSPYDSIGARACTDQRRIGDSGQEPSALKAVLSLPGIRRRRTAAEPPRNRRGLSRHGLSARNSRRTSRRGSMSTSTWSC